MELRQYIAVITKHWLLIVALLVAAVVTSYVASSVMTPIYQASTTILIKDQNSLKNPFLEAFDGVGRSQVADFVEVLKSKSLLYAVARRHHLVTSPNAPELDDLRKTVTVQPVTNTNVIRITVESSDPRLAPKLANGLVAEFILQNQKEDSTEARGARGFVGSQIRVIAEDLARAEEALRSYKKDNKVFAPDEEVKVALDQVAKLETMRAETAVSSNEVTTRLDQLTRQLAAQKQTVVSATTISANPLIQSLSAKLSDLEVELSGAREKYADGHPAVTALRAQIEELKGQMKRAAERIVSSQTETANPIFQDLFMEAGRLQVERLALDVRQNTLTRLLAEQDKVFAELPDKELMLASLTRNAKVTEQIYLMLKQKYEELRITEAMKSGNVRVIDEAGVPSRPVRPRKALNMAIAAFLSLFVGLGAAFLSEYLDTSLKTPEDIEQALGLPVLGQIPVFSAESLSDGGSRSGRRRREGRGR
jgi:polysaccharide chain length determinant protein (PEP-CTERM system associated)